MNLQTKIPLTRAANQIDYTSQSLLLGSCFSENIGEKLTYFKFQSNQNPFGILFHPLAIEKLILKASKKETYSVDDIFFLNERWYCFDAHSEVSDTSEENLLEKLNSGLKLTFEQITKATHVVITLGTAWVYRHQKTNHVVANCHKVPQKEFSKELLAVDEIQKSLENTIRSIRSLHKKVHFVLTVSPVRHLKDGFVANQRSKAHLTAAIQETLYNSNNKSHISYFPSYEIMMDELRDYRFYKVDMVHPNQLAIDYIWDKFKYVWISKSAYGTMDKVEEIQKGLAHRPFHKSSEQHGRFLKSLEKKITYLQQQYDFMDFEHPS